MKNFTVLTLLLGLFLLASCNTTKNRVNEEAAMKAQQEAKAEQMAMEEAKKQAAEMEATAKAEAEAKVMAEAKRNAKIEAAAKEKVKAKNPDMVMTETPGTLAFAAANDRYAAEGVFKSWSFQNVSMDGADVESLMATVLIDLTSIHEKNPQLTDHLKAPDFFNIAVFKEATLDIKNVKSKGNDMYTADMILNMKGLTQKMMSEFTVTSMDPFTVKGSAEVNRNLFGLGGEIGVPEMVKVMYDTKIPMMK